jgi:hypothetical protein
MSVSYGGVATNPWSCETVPLLLLIIVAISMLKHQRESIYGLDNGVHNAQPKRIKPSNATDIASMSSGVKG